jgi:hypothetical protein
MEAGVLTSLPQLSVGANEVEGIQREQTIGRRNTSLMNFRTIKAEFIL